MDLENDNFIKIIQEYKRLKSAEKSFQDQSGLVKKADEIYNNYKRIISALDRASGSFCIINNKKKILNIWGTLFARFGKEKDYFKGKNIEELSEIIPTGIFNEAIKKVLNKENVVFEWHLNYKKRTYFCQTSFMPILDDSENVLKILGVTQDITELEELQLSLVKSEKRIRSILENVDLAVIIYDENGEINFVNNYIQKISGYKLEELHSMNWWEYFGISLKSNGLKEDQKKLENENTKKILSKKGEVRFIYWKSMQLENDDNRIKEFISFGQDITEKQNLIESLKKSESEFRKIFENSAVGLVRSTVEGNILMANYALLEILECQSAEELIGKINAINFYVNPKDREEFIRILKEEGYVFGFEFDIRTLAGNIKTVRESAKAFLNDEGEIDYFECVIEDISDKKKIIKMLKQAKEKAEASEKFKSEMLSLMSHEIRTPLNIILNSVDLISQEIYEEAHPEIFDAFNLISENTQRIVRTVNLIVTIAEIKSGIYKKEPEKIDIMNEILLPLKKRFQKTLEIKRLNLIIQKSTDEAVAFVDPIAIKEIIYHLVDNAVKYTLEGTVIIRFYYNTENKLVLEINDTGIGMSKEFMGKMFDLFTQESHGYTRTYDGLGMGLSLVKEYCDINHIKINVKSAPRKGTNIMLIIPTQINVENNKQK